eukprot:2684847-Rhodomonas_salina.3
MAGPGAETTSSAPPASEWKSCAPNRSCPAPSEHPPSDPRLGDRTHLGALCLASVSVSVSVFASVSVSVSLNLCNAGGNLGRTSPSRRARCGRPAAAARCCAG